MPARRTRTELHDIVASRIPDNPADAITPEDVREVLDEFTASTWNLADDGTGTGSGGTSPPPTVNSTNLSISRGTNSIRVNSDTGTDAIIPMANASQAGLMTGADKAALDDLLTPLTTNEVIPSKRAVFVGVGGRSLLLKLVNEGGASGATGPTRDIYDVPEAVYNDVVANMDNTGVYLSPSQDPSLIGKRILFIDPAATPMGSGANYLFECGPARSLGVTPAPLYWFSTVVEHV